MSTAPSLIRRILLLRDLMFCKRLIESYRKIRFGQRKNALESERKTGYETENMGECNDSLHFLIFFVEKICFTASQTVPSPEKRK